MKKNYLGLILFFFGSCLHAMEIGQEVGNPDEEARDPLEALYKSTAHLKRIEPDLVKCSKIVDLGCRDGQLAAFLAEKYPASTIFGIDFSDEWIDKAKAKYSHLPNLSFYLFNEFSFVKDKEELDLVVFMGELHWTFDQKGYLEKILNCLKSDGKIFLSTAAEIVNSEELVLINAQLHHQERKDPEPFRYFHPLTPQEFKKLTDEVCLSWIKTSVVEKKIKLDPTKIDQLSRTIAHNLVKALEGPMEEEVQIIENFKKRLEMCNNIVKIPQLIFCGKKAAT